MMHLEAIIEKNKSEETVTISKVYFEALERARKQLIALEAAGVDNWEGYAEAFADEANGMEDGSPFPGRDITASEDE